MSVPTSAAAMAAAAAAAVSGVSFPGMGGPGAAIPGATRIVVLADAVTLEEISIEEEYSDILEVCAWGGGGPGVCCTGSMLGAARPLIIELWEGSEDVM